MIFNQSQQTAEGVSFFSDRGNIPFNILQALKTMTRGLEVNARSITDWRDAISLGFRQFDHLIKNNGGIVICDLGRQRMAYRAAR